MSAQDSGGPVVKSEGFSIDDIVHEVFEQPLANQIAILRALAPEIVHEIDEEEREGFVAELFEEIARREFDQPT
jgi:hypothetical protein